MAEDEELKEREARSNEDVGGEESEQVSDEDKMDISGVPLVTEFNHERFKNIAAGVQSCVIAVSVVIGGIWTYYLFKALNAKGRAIAELHELELRDREQGVIDIEISAKQVAIPGGTGRDIAIDIKVKNLGNRNNP